MLPKTPIPPYYAVIFSSKRNHDDGEAYDKMGHYMEELVQEQEGYIAHESYRNEAGYGVTISYWSNLESISNWKKNMEHRGAQKQGKDSWYSAYQVRIAKVERDYSF